MAFIIWFIGLKNSGTACETSWLLLGILSMLSLACHPIFPPSLTIQWLTPQAIMLPVKLNMPNSAPLWYGVFAPFWLGLAIFLLVDGSWPKYKHQYVTEHYGHFWYLCNFTFNSSWATLSSFLACYLLFLSFQVCWYPFVFFLFFLLHTQFISSTSLTFYRSLAIFIY